MAQSSDVGTFLQGFMELPCISNPPEMNSITGLPAGYPLEEVVHGGVTCKGVPEPTAIAVALVLLALHFGLFLAPLVCALLLRKNAKNEAAMALGFAAFSMASEGEILLHFDARWLYFTLIPTIHQVFFYSGLTLGQVLLPDPLVS